MTPRLIQDMQDVKGRAKGFRRSSGVTRTTARRVRALGARVFGNLEPQGVGRAFTSSSFASMMDVHLAARRRRTKW
jgi:hypothetical protein